MYLNLLSDFNAVLPEKFQFNDTENNKDIAKMFTHGWLVPFLFRYCYTHTFVEELIFRHLIIHELGKINLRAHVYSLDTYIC